MFIFLRFKLVLTHILCVKLKIIFRMPSLGAVACIDCMVLQGVGTGQLDRVNRVTTPPCGC